MTRHGTILGGVVATPDLAGSLDDYAGRLGLQIVERGTLSAEIAASWDCAGVAGAPSATLRPASGAPCWLRLVEQVLPDDFQPVRSFGWAAFEFSVQDVYALPGRLLESGFTVVGPPKPIANLPYFVPMQVTGRGREMIYLNEVHADTPSSDLPKAASPTDRIFIVILATADRAGAVDWLRRSLGLDEGGSYTLEYTMINTAFGLPAGTQSTITMVQKGRLPIIEVDQYPAAAAVRAGPRGGLPPGNAVVTLAVEDLAAVRVPFITPPRRCDGALYEGRRAACVLGSAGELIELVEIER